MTGHVPDVRHYVTDAAVSIAPLRIARGTQNKILESMAMGVPVVASEQAAVGIDAVPGEHFLVASTPENTGQTIIGLLENPAERQRLAHAARARVRSHHGWEGSVDRLTAQLSVCLPS